MSNGMREKLRKKISQKKYIQCNHTHSKTHSHHTGKPTNHQHRTRMRITKEHSTNNKYDQNIRTMYNNLYQLLPSEFRCCSISIRHNSIDGVVLHFQKQQQQQKVNEKQ